VLDVLSDNDKSNYDRFGSTDGKSSGNPFGGGQGFGFNMDDIFSLEIFFGGGQQFGGQQRRQQKGGDLNIRLSLNIEEIITGLH
jgi:molecular chaperone DnaJ